MRNRVYSKKFNKKLTKLKGQELINVLKKIDEVLICSDISHFKNLKYELKKYKRIHINTHYVILFFEEKTDTIYFEDYEHHDKVYLN